MTSNFRKTLIAAAVTALIAAPVWAAGDTRSTGAATESGAMPGTTGTATGTTGAATGAPGATGTTSTPGMRGQGADTGTSSTGPQAGQAGAQQMDGPLYSRTVSDLKGMDVVDQSGDDIGKIDSIVVGPDRQQAHAIVTIGGLLGMGGRDVMVSLDQLQLEGDDKLRINSTREQLETLPKVSSDQEDRYVEVTGDRPLRESIQDFAAFEPGQQGQQGQQPGGTLSTPQPSMGQPGAPGMGDGGGPSGTTPRTQERGTDTTPGAGQGTPQTPR